MISCQSYGYSLYTYMHADDFKVFVSFSTPESQEDGQILYEMLDKEGCKPWSQELLKVGDNLSSKIFSALKKCSAIVPVVTRSYASSITCLREFYYASVRTPEKPMLCSMVSDIDDVEFEEAGTWLLSQVKAYKYLLRTQTEELVKQLKEKVLNHLDIMWA